MLTNFEREAWLKKVEQAQSTKNRYKHNGVEKNYYRALLVGECIW